MKYLLLVLLLSSCSHLSEEQKQYCHNLNIIQSSQQFKSLSEKECLEEYNKLEMKEDDNIQLSPFIPNFNQKI